MDIKKNLHSIKKRITFALITIKKQVYGNIHKRRTSNLEKLIIRVYQAIAVKHGAMSERNSFS